MAGFQLAVESENRSVDEVMEMNSQGAELYYYDDVSPMFLWGMQCIPDEGMGDFFRGMPGFTRDDFAAVTAYMADDELPDPEECWRTPAEMAKGLRLLAQACRQGQPGAQMIWDQTCDVFSSIEETDGGRRVFNVDGGWDNAPGDWASVCAEELEGFARLIDALEREGERRVRLVIFTQ